MTVYIPMERHHKELVLGVLVKVSDSGGIRGTGPTILHRLCQELLPPVVVVVLDLGGQWTVPHIEAFHIFTELLNLMEHYCYCE